MKEDVKKKVPARFQHTREFKALLSMLEQRKIASTAALRMFLDVQIASCKANLGRSSASSTGQHHRRECAKHLELYQAIRTKFVPYL
jgi:hypothetical protein